MSTQAIHEVKENILAAIAASSDEDFTPEDLAENELLARELACTFELNSKGGVMKALEAAGMDFTDLAEYMGVEPGELVDGLIEELQAAAQKITGDLAQTSVGPAATFTASTTTGSLILNAVSSTAGLALGQPVAGTGIPAGATIAAINPTAATVTLAAGFAATATASGITVTPGELQVLALGDFTIDWKRKTAESTTTDDASYESSLGSTASWSVKSKYMFLIGDLTQAAAIISAIQSPQSPQQWNFFPTVGTGLPAYKGLAYIDGITISAGVGKIVGLDVSLKGTGPLNVATQTAPVANASTTTGTQAED